jgi:hypothetical protein
MILPLHNNLNKEENKMKSYTFQEALSQCTVNKVSFINCVGDIIVHAHVYGMVMIIPAQGTTGAILNVNWRKINEK